MSQFKRSRKIAFVIGALIGFVLTRLPYMEDGNLLVTNVCALIGGLTALLIWMVIEKFRGL
jgi:hypothetical protein